MPKIYKPGKVAVVLSGRFAGKKVVVIKQLDEGNKERSYPHAIVAGIERYPRRVKRGMGAKKVAKRSHIKPFIKAINYNHLMPTRYAVDLEGLKGLVTTDTFKEVEQKQDAKKQISKLFVERYTTGKNAWFFQPLRFSVWLVFCVALQEMNEHPSSPGPAGLPQKPKWASTLPPMHYSMTSGLNSSLPSSTSHQLGLPFSSSAPYSGLPASTVNSAPPSSSSFPSAPPLLPSGLPVLPSTMQAPAGLSDLEKLKVLRANVLSNNNPFFASPTDSSRRPHPEVMDPISRERIDALMAKHMPDTDLHPPEPPLLTAYTNNKGYNYANVYQSPFRAQPRKVVVHYDSALSAPEPATQTKPLDAPLAAANDPPPTPVSAPPIAVPGPPPSLKRKNVDSPQPQSRPAPPSSIDIPEPKRQKANAVTPKAPEKVTTTAGAPRSQPLPPVAMSRPSSRQVDAASIPERRPTRFNEQEELKQQEMAARAGKSTARAGDKLSEWPEEPKGRTAKPPTSHTSWDLEPDLYEKFTAAPSSSLESQQPREPIPGESESRKITERRPSFTAGNAERSASLTRKRLSPPPAIDTRSAFKAVPAASPRQSQKQVTPFHDLPRSLGERLSDPSSRPPVKMSYQARLDAGLIPPHHAKGSLLERVGPEDGRGRSGNSDRRAPLPPGRDDRPAAGEGVAPLIERMGMTSSNARGPTSVPIPPRADDRSLRDRLDSSNGPLPPRQQQYTREQDPRDPEPFLSRSVAPPLPSAARRDRALSPPPARRDRLPSPPPARRDRAPSPPSNSTSHRPLDRSTNSDSRYPSYPPPPPPLSASADRYARDSYPSPPNYRVEDRRPATAYQDRFERYPSQLMYDARDRDPYDRRPPPPADDYRDRPDDRDRRHDTYSSGPRSAYPSFPDRDGPPPSSGARDYLPPPPPARDYYGRPVPPPPSSFDDYYPPPPRAAWPDPRDREAAARSAGFPPPPGRADYPPPPALQYPPSADLRYGEYPSNRESNNNNNSAGPPPTNAYGFPLPPPPPGFPGPPPGSAPLQTSYRDPMPPLNRSARLDEPLRRSVSSAGAARERDGRDMRRSASPPPRRVQSGNNNGARGPRDSYSRR